MSNTISNQNNEYNDPEEKRLEKEIMEELHPVSLTQAQMKRITMSPGRRKCPFCGSLEARSIGEGPRQDVSTLPSVLRNDNNIERIRGYSSTCDSCEEYYSIIEFWRKKQQDFRYHAVKSRNGRDISLPCEPHYKDDEVGITGEQKQLGRKSLPDVFVMLVGFVKSQLAYPFFQDSMGDPILPAWPDLHAANNWFENGGEEIVNEKRENIAKMMGDEDASLEFKEVNKSKIINILRGGDGADIHYMPSQGTVESPFYRRIKIRRKFF